MKDAKVELMEQLLARVQLARRKGPPEVAGFAAQLEIEFKTRIEQLLSQKPEEHPHPDLHEQAA